MSASSTARDLRSKTTRPLSSTRSASRRRGRPAKRRCRLMRRRAIWRVIPSFPGFSGHARPPLLRCGVGRQYSVSHAALPISTWPQASRRSGPRERSSCRRTSPSARDRRGPGSRTEDTSKQPLSECCSGHRHARPADRHGGRCGVTSLKAYTSLRRDELAAAIVWRIAAA